MAFSDADLTNLYAGPGTTPLPATQLSDDDLTRRYSGAPDPYAYDPNNPTASVIKGLAHQAGEGARFVGTGVASGLGDLGDFLTHGANYLVDPVGALGGRPVGPEGQGSGDWGSPGTAASNAFFGTVMSPSQPNGPVERLLMAGIQGGAGGAPFGLIGAGRGILGDVGAQTGFGALSGGLAQGAAELGGNRAWQFGAAALPAVLAPGGARLIERLASPEDQAFTRIGRNIAVDERAGGPGVPQMTAALDQSGLPTGYQPKPLAIADVAGEGVKGLAENAVTRAGESRQVGKGFLDARDVGAGSRLIADIKTGLADGQGNFRTAQQLDQQAATVAGPLYEQARAANQSISSPGIDAILATPQGKQALAAARVKMQNDVQQNGLPLLQPGTPPAGPVTPGGGYSLTELDYVKRALDDQIGAAKRGGALDDARIFTKMKKSLLSEIDQNDATAVRGANGKIVTPGAYAQARAAYSGPAGSQDALEGGASFATKEPDQIADEYRALSPTDQQFYRLGVANALAHRVRATSLGGNEALRVTGNQAIMDQLRPLFANDADFGAFIKQAQNEGLMFTTRAQMTGGSPTMRRYANAQTENEGGGIVAPVAQVVTGLASGEPVVSALGIPKLIKGIGDWYKGTNLPSNPAVNAAISRILFNGDPVANQAALTRLGQPAVSYRPTFPALIGNPNANAALLGAPQPQQQLIGPAGR